MLPAEAVESKQTAGGGSAYNTEARYRSQCHCVTQEKK